MTSEIDFERGWMACVQRAIDVCNSFGDARAAAAIDKYCVVYADTVDFDVADDPIDESDRQQFNSPYCPLCCEPQPMPEGESHAILNCECGCRFEAEFKRVTECKQLEMRQ